MEFLIYRPDSSDEEIIKLTKQKTEDLKDLKDIKLIIDVQIDDFSKEVLSECKNLCDKLDGKLIKLAIICKEKIFKTMLLSILELKPNPNIFSTSAQAEQWIMK